MARKARSLLFNLGSMFGNIAAGVKADVRAGMPRRLGGEEGDGRPGHSPRTRTFADSGPASGQPVPPAQASQIVQQRVQEVVVSTPQGPVVLRRTVTDEVRPASEGRT